MLRGRCSERGDCTASECSQRELCQRHTAIVGVVSMAMQRMRGHGVGTFGKEEHLLPRVATLADVIRRREDGELKLRHHELDKMWIECPTLVDEKRDKGRRHQQRVAAVHGHL